RNIRRGRLELGDPLLVERVLEGRAGTVQRSGQRLVVDVRALGLRRRRGRGGARLVVVATCRTHEGEDHEQGYEPGGSLAGEQGMCLLRVVHSRAQAREPKLTTSTPKVNRRRTRGQLRLDGCAPAW